MRVGIVCNVMPTILHAYPAHLDFGDLYVTRVVAEITAMTVTLETETA